MVELYGQAAGRSACFLAVGFGPGGLEDDRVEIQEHGEDQVG
jgi:hypothetical protein